MPITEIVRVLAVSGSPEGTLELLYDVDGSAKPDEQTVGWPRFWIRRADGRVHGPFDDEDDAVAFGVEALGAAGWESP